MKKALIIILSFLILTFVSTASHAWLIYHKPEFKGKVIDTETKEPIEGAVAVVVYNKSTIGLGAGTVSDIVNVRETLTDKDGIFHIPSYTTIIQPFSWEISATFIIFKPGYGSFPNYRTNPPMKLSNPALEQFFSGEVGKEGVVTWHGELDKVTFGIVELPKLKTREERLDASRVGVSGYRAKDLPLLYKAINEEAKYLGIPERE